MGLTVQDLADELEELNTSPSEERLARSAALAEHLESLLADYRQLGSVADRIAELADRKGCDALLGASEFGNRLTGAVVAKAANGLRSYDPKSPSRHVLVLDGLYVTGSQLERAARSAADSGAGIVSAAVLLSAVADPKLQVNGEREVSVIGV